MPIENCKIGLTTKIWHIDLVNLYGCTIGENCRIGAFVEIGPNVSVGNNVSIGASSFVPEGVSIEDDVFVGPHVVFTNDKYPPSSKQSWKPIVVRQWASIGANSTILPGVTIGAHSVIGAGSIVSKDVLPFTKVWGTPAKKKGATEDRLIGHRIDDLNLGVGR